MSKLSIPEYLLIKGSVLALIFLVIGVVCAFGQKIYSVEHEYQADVKVFVVDAECKADPLVLKTDRKYKAKEEDNMRIWFLSINISSRQEYFLGQLLVSS